MTTTKTKLSHAFRTPLTIGSHHTGIFAYMKTIDFYGMPVPWMIPSWDQTIIGHFEELLVTLQMSLTRLRRLDVTVVKPKRW